jgi:hypothetical protein
MPQSNAQAHPEESDNESLRCCICDNSYRCRRTAHAGDLAKTGTAFEISKQYADGGKFGGVTSGHTGTVLGVAQDSLNFLGTPDRVASTWRMPRIVAKGD